MTHTKYREQISGFSNYYIYRDGRVEGPKGFMSIQDNGNGYKKVILYKNSKTYKNMYIHRLVASHFLENTMEHSQVDRIDRNKENNHYTNLRWTSSSGNIENNAGKSRYSVCRKNSRIYSDLDRELISFLYSEGLKVMEIARKLSMTRQTVSRLKEWRII